MSCVRQSKILKAKWFKGLTPSFGLRSEFNLNSSFVDVCYLLSMLFTFDIFALDMFTLDQGYFKAIIVDRG